MLPADACQQMRARRLRRGAAAQPLAIHRHMADRWCLAHDSTAQCLFQRGYIQLLEQFAPHRWGGHAAPADTDGQERFAVQPSSQRMIPN